MPLPTVLFNIVFNPFEIEVGPKTMARMGLLTSGTFPPRQRHGNITLQGAWDALEPVATVSVATLLIDTDFGFRRGVDDTVTRL